MDDGGAGGGAVKVAGAPFPSLTLGDSAAVRRGALLMSRWEGVCGLPAVAVGGPAALLVGVVSVGGGGAVELGGAPGGEHALAGDLAVVGERGECVVELGGARVAVQQVA